MAARVKQSISHISSAKTCVSKYAMFKSFEYDSVLTKTKSLTFRDTVSRKPNPNGGMEVEVQNSSSRQANHVLEKLRVVT